MFAQLYFYDPVDVLHYRMNRNQNLKRKTMECLQNILMETNRYKHLLRNTFNVSLTQKNRYKDLFLHAFEILNTTPS